MKRAGTVICDRACQRLIGHEAAQRVQGGPLRRQASGSAGCQEA